MKTTVSLADILSLALDSQLMSELGKLAWLHAHPDVYHPESRFGSFSFTMGIILCLDNQTKSCHHDHPQPPKLS